MTEADTAKAWLLALVVFAVAMVLREIQYRREERGMPDRSPGGHHQPEGAEARMSISPERRAEALAVADHHLERPMTTPDFFVQAQDAADRLSTVASVFPDDTTCEVGKDDLSLVIRALREAVAPHENANQKRAVVSEPVDQTQDYVALIHEASKDYIDLKPTKEQEQAVLDYLLLGKEKPTPVYGFAPPKDIKIDTLLPKEATQSMICQRCHVGINPTMTDSTTICSACQRRTQEAEENVDNRCLVVIRQARCGRLRGHIGRHTPKATMEAANQRLGEVMAKITNDPHSECSANICRPYFRGEATDACPTAMSPDYEATPEQKAASRAEDFERQAEANKDPLARAKADLRWEIENVEANASESDYSGAQVLASRAADLLVLLDRRACRVGPCTLLEGHDGMHLATGKDWQLRKPREDTT